MPVRLPVLDDRNYEQILTETLRRIPVHTPEWTNYSIESDPGRTLIQLFAFMTESLLYRANRVPELNRLKFLQLLNVPLLPAAAANGIVTITNERGPVQPLLLEQGIELAAGNAKYTSRDPLNVLPVQAQLYYKRPIPTGSASYDAYRERYECVLSARLAAQADAGGLPFPGSSEFEALGITPQFYEPVLLAPPQRGEPPPAFDLEATADRSLYLALLAPQNVDPSQVRRELAHQVLSIGIAPTGGGTLPALLPMRSGSVEPQVPGLVFEIADTSASTSQHPVARYAPLQVIQQMDVFSAPGLVMVELPAADQLVPWTFDEPLEEGTSDFPPRLEDEQIQKRLVTWLRIRLPEVADEQLPEGLDRRLAWVGINATRVLQAVPVVNEYLGQGTGEPDHSFALANVPVIPESLRLAVQETAGSQSTWVSWQMVDDLLSYGPDDRVYTVDAESGLVRFGDGLRGLRPRGRILATYEYGGGPQGNVAIGAINGSPDPRLQGGYKVNNDIPTSGGAVGETVDEGVRRMPLVLRHRDRLVTAPDFRAVTRRTPGVSVGRVEVLPLFMPGKPEQEAPGVVTVMVIPRSDPSDPLWPVPDRLSLRRICRHLDERRLVTTELYVRGPEYVPVYVSVGIQVRAGFFVDQVERDVETVLRQYLSSLPPGGPEGSGWPLDTRLVRSELAAVAARVPGVHYVEGLQMSVQNSQDVDEYDGLTGLKLPRLAGVKVRQGAPDSPATVFAPSGSVPTLTETVPIPVIKDTCG